jgi:hypothetical protein
MKAILITLLAFGTILSSLMAQGGPPPSPVKAAVVMVETLQKRVKCIGICFKKIRGQATASAKSHAEVKTSACLFLLYFKATDQSADLTSNILNAFHRLH